MNIRKYLSPDQLQFLNNYKGGRKHSAALISVELEFMGVINREEREFAFVLGIKAINCKERVEDKTRYPGVEYRFESPLDFAYKLIVNNPFSFWTEFKRLLEIYKDGRDIHIHRLDKHYELKGVFPVSEGSHSKIHYLEISLVGKLKGTDNHLIEKFDNKKAFGDAYGLSEKAVNDAINNGFIELLDETGNSVFYEVKSHFLNPIYSYTEQLNNVLSLEEIYERKKKFMLHDPNSLLSLEDRIRKNDEIKQDLIALLLFDDHHNTQMEKFKKLGLNGDEMLLYVIDYIDKGKFE